MKTIFAIDDSDTNLRLLEIVLGEIYDLFTISSARKMFDLLEKVTPDIILLDLEMPEMNGFQAFQKLKLNKFWANIPVIFLTSCDDQETEVKCLEMGAVDFITKPFSNPVLLNRVRIHLDIYRILREKTSLIDQLHSGVVSVLAEMFENRDKGTSGHIDRTSKYMKLLIEGMKSAGVYANETREWDVERMIFSSRMHDLGKISINDSIVNKPGKLSDAEFEIMKTHAAQGEEIIEKIIEQTGEVELLRDAKLFAGNHHERWDGKGYPRGLKETEIPLHGRLMAVADVYDNLVSERPYKKAFTHNEAVRTILNHSGTYYDPKIVEVFFDVKDRFEEISREAC